MGNYWKLKTMLALSCLLILVLKIGDVFSVPVYTIDADNVGYIDYDQTYNFEDELNGNPARHRNLIDVFFPALSHTHKKRGCRADLFGTCGSFRSSNKKKAHAEPRYGLSLTDLQNWFE